MRLEQFFQVLMRLRFAPIPAVGLPSDRYADVRNGTFRSGIGNISDRTGINRSLYSRQMSLSSRSNRQLSRLDCNTNADRPVPSKSVLAESENGGGPLLSFELVRCDIAFSARLAHKQRLVRAIPVQTLPE